MHPLISKYTEAYQNASGTQTEKVKQILMHYVDSWDWAGGESLIIDLLDDSNITAGDIVELLHNIYQQEGGNDEFRYAIKAIEIALQREKLQEAKAKAQEELGSEAYEEEEFDGINCFMPQHKDFLSKHQSLSH